MAARLCRLWRISRRRGYLSLEPLARPLTKADLLHLPAFILWLMTLLTRPPWPRQRNSWTASWSADPGKHKSKKKKKKLPQTGREVGEDEGQIITLFYCPLLPLRPQDLIHMDYRLNEEV